MNFQSILLCSVLLQEQILKSVHLQLQQGSEPKRRWYPEIVVGFQVSVVKNLLPMQETLIPSLSRRSGRSPGGGNDHHSPVFLPGNPWIGGAWWFTVHVNKEESDTQLDSTTTTNTNNSHFNENNKSNELLSSLLGLYNNYFFFFFLQFIQEYLLLPGRRAWQLALLFLSHSLWTEEPLAGCSPEVAKESDKTASCTK